MRRFFAELFTRITWATVRTVAWWTWIALGYIGKSVILMILALWIGVPRATDMIANEWLDRANLSNYTNRMDWLYWSVRITATILIIFCWICFSFTTVFTVLLIF